MGTFKLAHPSKGQRKDLARVGHSPRVSSCRYVIGVIVAAALLSGACAQQPSGAPSLDELQQQLEQKKEEQQKTDESRAAEQRAPEARKQKLAAEKKAAAEQAERKALVDAAEATSLTCEGSQARSKSNISFHNRVSYHPSTSAAGAFATWTLQWDVTNNSSGGNSGSLRVDLYAVKESATVERVGADYFIASFYPNFSGNDGQSTAQLLGGHYVDNIENSTTVTNPPIGKYCIVALLKEYTDTCTSGDHYCWDAWVQFPGAQLFN